MINGDLLSERFSFQEGIISPLIGPKAMKAKQAFNKKINSGLYKFEDCKCYCGSEEGRILSETDRYGNYYPFVICNRCGIMRANPRLSLDSYVDFYENDYRTLYGDDEDKLDSLYSLRQEQAEKVFNFISGRIALEKDSVVFDIGCNMGTMLLPFLKAGCRVSGVDYGHRFIEYGKSRGNAFIEVGGIDKLFEKNERANLIILNHVLEHFVDLQSELMKIRELLAPGGLLYVSVPGTFWWIKHRCRDDILAMLQNAHLWQFSLNSLRYVLECSGFEIVCGNHEVRAIFEKCNGFRQISDFPKNEFDLTVKYLRMTEKRFLRKLYWIKTLRLNKLSRILYKNG